MLKEINQPIVGYEVVNESPSAVDTKADGAAVDELVDNVIHMHEKVERPEILIGSTYKIKTPMSEHALYITINDIVLNEGTAHELRRPFEVFINSKNMDHFQWVVALTRVISAVFRKGGDVTFLTEELKAVFDPKGGYFKKGGVFMPSLVAEMGHAIERHLTFIGLIQPIELDAHQQAFVDEKTTEAVGTIQKTVETESSYPVNATLCTKCFTKAVIFNEGCMTCLSCSDSKCG
ncbi:MAG: NrdJb [Pseudomonadales bacterium]|nr:NrdJb [Pseudomonadales bacterium]